MKLNCMIVDDEPMARIVLEEYIEDVDFLQLAGKAENPVKAKQLLENQRIDLLFLDINMPRMSGIDFLRSGQELPLTILTTAYTQYAVEGFELDVVDYLVKPFSFERFVKACERAKEYAELKNKPAEMLSHNPADNYFFVKCDGKIEKILYDDLIYVEAMLNYIVLHTATRKLVVYLTIKSITEQLPSNFFLKIHKSTIINTSKIKSIEGNEIDMGKAKVTISQNSYDSVMKEILKGRMIKR
ncbi:LytR/AlgR family response regulator transcription factor [Parasediminibacterium sp. JCM 36343]|uniref:LytR/AlgR family response regulator transcription factor n=1 Tax=Parasediminibacterium sp. JCM 36343 TaxID=3374279 RepID=UPI003979262C